MNGILFKQAYGDAMLSVFSTRLQMGRQLPGTLGSR
jgi:hypothetical protein